MNAFVKEVTDADFEKEVLQADKPVLVDFWAVWCGPCRAIAPAVESIAETFASRAVVAKLNIDDSPLTPQKYGVRAIPTLILFKGGEEVERIMGLTNKGRLAELVEKHAGAAGQQQQVASS
jgi:thioredoxin 1